MSDIQTNRSSAEWVGDQKQIPTDVGIEGMSFDGMAVLDVGCGTGKDLMHPAFARASQRCGVDPSTERVTYGRAHFPQLDLTEGYAESLPYADEQFDVVLSRVTLPLTNIPVALAEIHRVMKPGGQLLLTMHDWRLELRFLTKEIRALSLRGLVRHAYVLTATAGYVLTGKVLRHPWAPARECFQTRGSLSRSLLRAGFTDFHFERTPRDWIVTAKKQGHHKLSKADGSP